MPTSRLQNYLASDEELLLSFSAENVLRRGSDDGESFSQTLESAQFDSDYEFGATDRRIVYVTGTGGFKDIEYSHISSIESATETDNSEQLGAFVLGCCGGILALGGLTSIGDKPGTALFGIILGGFLFAAAVKVYQNANSSTKQKVKFITGDEASQKIEVTLSSDAGANVGAELSQILREQR
jgi:hypothetical protein